MQRESRREHRAGPLVLVRRPNLAAVQLDQIADERQPEPQPPRRSRRRRILLRESIEDPRQELGIDARAAVGHGQTRDVARRSTVSPTVAAPRRELDGVGEQVPDDLPKTGRITEHENRLIRDREVTWTPFACAAGMRRRHRVPRPIGQRDGTALQAKLAGQRLGDVEQIAGQLRLRAGRFVRPLRSRVSSRGVELAVRSRCSQPSTEFSGVRSSCEIVARNSSFMRPGGSLSRRASCASCARCSAPRRAPRSSDTTVVNSSPERRTARDASALPRIDQAVECIGAPRIAPTTVAASGRACSGEPGARHHGGAQEEEMTTVVDRVPARCSIEDEHIRPQRRRLQAQRRGLRRKRIRIRRRHRKQSSSPATMRARPPGRPSETRNPRATGRVVSGSGVPYPHRAGLAAVVRVAASRLEGSAATEPDDRGCRFLGERGAIVGPTCRPAGPSTSSIRPYSLAFAASR